MLDMIKCSTGGAYYARGEWVPADGNAPAALAAKGFDAAAAATAKTGTMAYNIMQAHNTSGDAENLKIKFDAMASHDITFVGIIQTARASGLEKFPIPYVLTNCHNSLCAVGGTINEDDHRFGLSAAKKYGGIFVPPHMAVIHQYMRERFAGCGKMILGSDSHTRYGALGTMAVGEGGGELAKQLVAESGYNGETLRMLVLPNATIKASVPLIKQYCAEIGVTLESLEYDMAEFRKVRTETTGEVYDIELLGATSADDTVYVSVKEIDDRAYANGLGRIFVKDEELQKLYEDAGNAATTSPEVIQSLLDRLEEQCYMYGLYYCPKMIFGRDCIKSATVIPFDDAIYPSFVVSK